MNLRGKSAKVAFIVSINYALIEIICISALGFLRYRGLNYDPIDTLALSDNQINSIRRFSANESGYIRFDRTLGWSIRKDSRTGNGMYKSNSDGIRGDKDYTFKITNGKLRITTFGDSFTHGDDVSNMDTWQSRMESKAPHLEVLNFGVGGYGLDQAYLRFLEHGSKYESNLVLIGFMTENINRNRNRFRPFYSRNTGLPFSKPMFVNTEDSLSLIPSYFRKPKQYNQLLEDKKNTLEGLGESDFYYHNGIKSNPYLDWSPAFRMIKLIRHQGVRKLSNPYTTDANALEVTKALFGNFRDKVESLGQKPIVVIFPSQKDIIRCNESKKKNHESLITYFRSNNFDFIDLTDQLCKHKVVDIFNGHYNQLGNTIVAETLLRHISK